MFEEYLYNKRQISQIWGLSAETISQWIAKGCPVHGKSGKSLQLYLPDVLKWKLTQGRSPSEKVQDLDLTEERTRLAKEQADKTAIGNAERRGEVVNAKQISLVWANIASILRTKILAIPTKASPLVLGCKTPAEAKEILEKYVHEVLNEFASSNPGTFTDSVLSESDKATAEVDSKRVGRQGKKAKSRKQRGAG